MPRRPRPASRPLPKSLQPPTAPDTYTLTRKTISPRDSKRKLRSVHNHVPQPSASFEDSEEKDDGGSEKGESDGSESSNSASEDEDGDDGGKDDPDQPRTAQWLDEDTSDVAPSSNDRKGKMRELQDGLPDLSSLPLGALLKASKNLEAQQSSDSESSFGDSESEPGGSETKHEKQRSSSKERRLPKWKSEIEKRSSKHAPTEVTSKIPVTRSRQVVEVKTVQSRDPRFNPMSGTFSEDHFSKNYGFMDQLHTSELTTLKTSLSRAKKLLLSSPRDLRPEREAEVERLERALKRAETMVQRDKRDKIEREAMQTFKVEERKKREEGKGQWYLKDSAKKELLLKARYDSLSKTGVKKAIEKKQKKVAQKEKKSRPFAKGQEFRSAAATGGTSRKRSTSETNHSDGGRAKRRKFS